MASIRIAYAGCCIAALLWIISPTVDHSYSQSVRCESGFIITKVNHCVENPIHIGEPIILSSASAEQLTSLPRVGSVMAQRLSDWNRSNTCTTINDLRQIKGVGVKTIEKWEGLLCCEQDCQ